MSKQKKNEISISIHLSTRKWIKIGRAPNVVRLAENENIKIICFQEKWKISGHQFFRAFIANKKLHKKNINRLYNLKRLKLSKNL